jgi:predicted dehydrogenase
VSAEPDVLVLGAGSIGCRHARNLAAAGASVALADPAATATSDDPDGVRRIEWADADPQGFAGVVVASPTVHHLAQATAAATAGANVLVEKPLATDVAGAQALLVANQRVRVGFNLRFHPPVRRLVDAVHGGRVGRVLAARLWFGYHLPSWRPGTDYRQSYSAQAELGGGILLDAIHELDLAVWLLGPDLTVDGARLARVGDLDLDVEDTVRAQLRTADGAPVEIALDYLSRDYRRGIEVIGTDATARLDWARGVFEIDDGERVTTAPGDDPVDASYEAEAETFLGWLDGADDLPVDVETALVSLRLADEIRERSA